MVGEIWKPVVGFEKYMVSDHGRVRREKKPISLRPGKSTGGVRIVSLCKDGVAKSYHVHKLVAEAFIGSCDGMFIQHIDGDQGNCRVDNLRLVPRKDGIRQRIEAARIANSVAVDQFLNNVWLASFESIAEAERKTGILQQNISACCRGELKTAGGYSWRYSEAPKISL